VTTRARNQLVEENLQEVRAIAARLSRKLPPSFDREDLVQQGCLGLIEAADRYDGRPGVKFMAYARRRVVGSMLDYIRRRHWKNGTAFGLQAVEALHHDPDAVAGRPGTVDETALGKTLSDESTLSSPDKLLQQVQEASEVHRALRRLPHRELVVIQGFYGRERTCDQIAPPLGISARRVAQIRVDAVHRLRRDLAGLRRVA
jgi:RNA polymerase sigma factor for flagellar operon FliA